MKHLTLALLQWVANGDQGQNIRNRVFPLNTGRSFFIVSWRTPDHFVQLHRSMLSLLKRSVASSSILLSRRDSTKRSRGGWHEDGKHLDRQREPDGRYLDLRREDDSRT